MKKAALFFGAVLIAVAIAAANVWRKLDAQRAQNADTAAHVAALQSLRSWEPRVAQAAAADSPNSAKALPAATQTGVPAAPAESRQADRGFSPLAAQMQQFRDSPEGREFQRVITRQMLEQEYSGLARELNISPEVEDRLLNLVARMRVDLDADRAKLASGGQDRAAREQMERNLVQKERAYDSEISTLLGGSYSKWQEYQRTSTNRQKEATARMAEEQLRRAIDPAEPLLTDEQFHYLNAALTAEQKRIDQESRGMNLSQVVQRLPEINRRLTDVAAGHLNAEQLDRYRRYLEQRAAMMSAAAAMVSK